MSLEQPPSPPLSAFTVIIPVKVEGPAGEEIETGGNRKVTSINLTLRVEAKSKADALARVVRAIQHAVVISH